MNEVVNEVKQEEVKQTRKAPTRFVLLEIYDKEGNLIEGLKADNIKVIADCKKIGEDFVEAIQSHPNAIIFKA